MPFIETQPAVLTAHASTPNDAVRSLGVQLRAEEPGILVFRYSLEADMSRVRMPPSLTGGRADALWRHTCFEAFVAPADGPGYHEFNFSPSLDWAIYRFSAYREGMSPAEVGRAPELFVRRRDDGLARALCARPGVRVHRLYGIPIYMVRLNLIPHLRHNNKKHNKIDQKKEFKHKHN